MTTPWYFNPILLQIGPVPIRWYGLMFALSFFIGYFWLYYFPAGKDLKMNNEQKDVLLMGSIFGVLLGGRLGYILFYNLTYYLQNPLKIFAVWEGGMSFHGGLIGVGIAMFWFTKKYLKTPERQPFYASSAVSFLKISDAVAGIVPIGIMLVRIGNFINSELYGRVASRFCIYFPSDPTHCRYPSQLFESFLEGFVLFFVLLIVRKISRKNGMVSSFFLIFYGIFRIVVEFFREPDVQVGYFWGIFTEGQILSSLMIFGGAILLFFVLKDKDGKKKDQISSIKPPNKL